jgi:hypothetical protein
MSGPKDLRPQLTQLAASLGAELGWVTVPSSPNYRYIDEATLDIGGMPVVLRAQTGSKGALMGATFTIEVGTPLVATPVTMRRETWLDRLGKNLFINREFQFGDEAFDSAVYIETDAPDASLQQLLSATAVRAALVKLAGGVAENVTCLQRSITATLPISRFGRHEGVRTLLETLVELGRAAEKQRIWLEPPVPRSLALIITAFVLSCATWLTAWAIAVFSGPSATIGWRAYQRGAEAGVVSWIVVVALCIALFRGRSTSFRVVITLAICSLGLILMGGNIADRLDTRWDHGPQTSMPGAAYRHYGGKGPPRAHVDAPPLASDVIVPDEIIDPRVQLSATRTPVRVSVGSGAFGSKWIAGVGPP